MIKLNFLERRHVPVLLLRLIATFSMIAECCLFYRFISTCDFIDFKIAIIFRVQFTYHEPRIMQSKLQPWQTFDSTISIYNTLNKLRTYTGDRTHFSCILRVTQMRRCHFIIYKSTTPFNYLKCRNQIKEDR